MDDIKQSKSNFYNRVVKNDLVQNLIKKYNLNQEQIESGLFIFNQIIQEQEQIKQGEKLDFISEIFIYDDKNITSVVVPYGDLKQKMLINKYHKLSDITKFNYDIKIDKNFDNTIVKKDTFNWKLNEDKRLYLYKWYKNFICGDKDINKQNKKGFYLKGSLGSGKSTFMQAFANNCLKSNKTFAYINLNDLNQRLKTLFDNNEKFEQTINELKNVDYLFIDDIGNERQSEWSLFNVLYPVLDHRVQNNKFNAFTSNLDYDGLKKLFNQVPNIDSLKIERLMDRIKCSTDLIYLNGFNLRLSFSYAKKEEFDANGMVKQKQKSM